jgi:diaminopimelate decarboxylase
VIDASHASASTSYGGVPAAELVATYGTPLVAIDLDEFELEVDRFTRAFVDRGITVAYAAKALLVTALAELLAATPLWLDVCSLGELRTAERGGFPAQRLYFHGVAKTDAELRAIAAGRVAFGVIDNEEEIERLAALAKPGAPIDVMLRINTGIEAHTHEFVRTGGENTKFGIPAADAHRAIARVAALPQLRLIDVECGDRRPERAAGTPYRLLIEPGRALIARAGSSLYSVVAVKRQGARRFVVVDGGMADNPRPLLYGARHAAEVAVSAARGDLAPATLAGRSCENDEIGEYALPSDLRAGDAIAMRYTGAYTYSMASNYNRFGKPPVIFVRDGTHRRVVRRESEDDILRNDLA